MNYLPITGIAESAYLKCISLCNENLLYYEYIDKFIYRAISTQKHNHTLLSILTAGKSSSYKL